jgi:circadian clock protein KaiB
MARKKTGRGASPPPNVSTVVVLVLYVTDRGPNAVQAIANLEAVCEEHLKDNFRLEIVDVLEYPWRALADGILVTPSLVKVSPPPAATVVGNLSDKLELLRVLGIRR